MSYKITPHIARVILAHGWRETLGWGPCGCGEQSEMDWIGYADHVAAKVTEMLLDMAGVGRLSKLFAEDTDGWHMTAQDIVDIIAEHHPEENP